MQTLITATVREIKLHHVASIFAGTVLQLKLANDDRTNRNVLYI